MVLYCIRAEYVALRCWDGCYKYVMLRCPVKAMCINCGKFRKKKIYSMLMQRYSECQETISDIVLWTLGTPHRSNPESRKQLSAYWKYFRARMNKKAEWSPLFRVVETGSRGQRLHIHFINEGYLKHGDVLRAWREVTNNKSNVNYSKKGNLEGKVALGYVTKYLTKDASKYSFLGKLYKVNLKDREKPTCDRHGHYYEYYNVVQNHYPGYSEVSDH